MDLLNLLEIFSQWQAFVKVHDGKLSDEAYILKEKLEKEVLEKET